jgi:hypothetical protein
MKGKAFASFQKKYLGVYESGGLNIIKLSVAMVTHQHHFAEEARS